ncbi:MAG: HAD family hydrolase [bacterium]
MARKLTRMAIAYDFDGTLAPGNMQEHSFIPELKLSIKDFWSEVKQIAKNQDMDEILAYMHLMLKCADASQVQILKKSFYKHGQKIELFRGVKEWFPRLDNYARDRGVKLEHYIISSGLREMVAGTPIAKRFSYIFASGFYYDQNSVATWPALAVNYTTKTQYLFRINKGILNSYDNTQINKFVPEEDRDIPFTHMAYIGDGETDVPCMKMIKYQGGCAIAVYNPNKRGSKHKKSSKDIALELLEQKRADYACPTDYTDGSSLDLLMKAFIDRVAATDRMKQVQTSKRINTSPSRILLQAGEAPNEIKKELSNEATSSTHMNAI